METFIATLLAVAYTICVLLFIWCQRCNNRTHFQKLAIVQFLWDTYAPVDSKINSVNDIRVVEDMWSKYNKLFDSCRNVHYITHLNALLWREDVKKLYPKEVHHLLD